MGTPLFNVNVGMLMGLTVRRHRVEREALLLPVTTDTPTRGRKRVEWIPAASEADQCIN
jgi:hypothetical protein